MNPDSADETLELKMGDLKIEQLPKTLPESTSPPAIYSLNSSELETQDRGLDFYSSPFDNSYPYKGILSNERTFSSSSTASVSSVTDTSFTQNMRCPQSDINSNDNYGLLTTSTPSRETREDGSSAAAAFHRLLDGGDFDGDFFPQGNHQFSDAESSNACGLSNKWESPTKSQNRFDFSFRTPESSFLNQNGSSGGRSIDSPDRSMNDMFINNYSNFVSYWNNNSDALSLLDNHLPESCGSTSTAAAITLGNSVWNTSQVANNVNDNDRQWDASILRTLSKQELLKFKATLKEKLDEFVREGNEPMAMQCQDAYVEVTEHLINNFLPVHDSEMSTGSPNGTRIVSPTSQNSRTVSPTSQIVAPLPFFPNSIDHGFDMNRARMHRNATEYKIATQTWHGILPPRNHRNATFSNKVFLGGLPWDIMESTLLHTFRTFDIIKIEWPGKEQLSSKPIKGYAYAIFETEKQVRNLLSHCTQDFTSSQEGKYFFKISSKKYRGKDVEVIPWGSTDSTFNHTCKIDANRTIFVGALHGMVNAEALAHIMNDLFGGVIFAGIDLDKNRYPIGSARVTFNKKESYLNAVNSRFVFIKTARFNKKLQVDPYLEDHTCDVCNLQQGPYFCREAGCFHYFCRTCFQDAHASPEMQSHEPIMRNHNNRQSYATSGTAVLRRNGGLHSPSYNRWSNNSNNGYQSLNGNHQSNGNENYYPLNGHHFTLNGNHHTWNGNHSQHGSGMHPNNRHYGGKWYAGPQRRGPQQYHMYNQQQPFTSQQQRW